MPCDCVLQLWFHATLAAKSVMGLPVSSLLGNGVGGPPNQAPQHSVDQLLHIVICDRFFGRYNSPSPVRLGALLMEPCIPIFVDQDVPVRIMVKVQGRDVGAC
uniref:Putative secreted protein n=1 Tax=Ixodes ricinus TaxID=34613 RepID=A0A6B0UFM0_IXORI